MHNILMIEHRSFLIAIILSALGFLNIAKDITKDALQPPLDFSNQILSSTVQIRIYDPENTYFLMDWVACSFSREANMCLLIVIGLGYFQAPKSNFAISKIRL